MADVQGRSKIRSNIGRLNPAPRSGEEFEGVMLNEVKHPGIPLKNQMPRSFTELTVSLFAALRAIRQGKANRPRMGGADELFFRPSCGLVRAAGLPDQNSKCYERTRQLV